MRKFLKKILILIVMINITGCNSREDVEHLSQKDLIKYVEKNITEEIQFIESNTENVDEYIYTFKLVDRNINFEVVDLISDQGFYIDGGGTANYKRSIKFYDYFKSILTNLEQERLNILSKYNFKEKELFHIQHEIILKNYTDLSNLSKYIIELDNLYKFNIKEVEKKELILLNDNYLVDVITFSNKGSIQGVHYSLNEKKRLKYDEVYKQLEKQYIEHLKKFSLTDKTIPQNVWDKY